MVRAFLAVEEVAEAEEELEVPEAATKEERSEERSNADQVQGQGLVLDLA